MTDSERKTKKSAKGENQNVQYDGSVMTPQLYSNELRHTHVSPTTANCSPRSSCWAIVLVGVEMQGAALLPALATNRHLLRTQHI